MPAKAEIRLSCLGHYQLLLNGQTVYRGPSFAVPPKVYYDSLDLKDKVATGSNKIEVICQYVNHPVQEYYTYGQMALLAGGEIEDGGISHFLADAKAWQVADLIGWQNGPALSSLAGYAEAVDLTKTPQLQESKTAEVGRLNPLPRPLPLLGLQKINLKKVSGHIFDLGVFTTGYLTANTSFKKSCHLKLTWGGVLDKNGQVIPYFNQQDEVTFPGGRHLWQQFSRRAGRYLQVDPGNCQTDPQLEFERVGMPFDLPQTPQLDDELDQKIFSISLNTLQNNLQDHFEDSLVRERALYSGDALAMARCLPDTSRNNLLIKEMAVRFGDNQTMQGLVPPITPGEKWTVIPSYALMWPALVNLYLQRSADSDFAASIWPKIEELLGWAGANESPEGFIYNRSQDEWWQFIDWTPFDTSYKFFTPLQVWYIEALETSAQIAALAGKEGERYGQKAGKLAQSLMQYAYDPEQKVFADSFDGQLRSKGSLVTNALAGKFGLFESKSQSLEASHHFPLLQAYTPYAQTWVVEWLFGAGDPGAARKALQEYWGGMAKEGATAVYEGYSKESAITDTNKEGQPVVPGSGVVRSFSHGWGCGPLLLYPLFF